MVVDGSYHVLFAWTGFLAREYQRSGAKLRRDTELLERLVDRHQAYLRQVYRAAGYFGAVGSAAFVWCVLTRATAYPAWTACFVPALSAPIKKAIKRKGVGAPLGLVLVGGFTNLWNLAFFVAVTAGLRIS